MREEPGAWGIWVGDMQAMMCGGLIGGSTLRELCKDKLPTVLPSLQGTATWRG